jgi:primosomal protein N' (replication factor Y)
MPAFCDVALPVPLDQTFTYAVNGVVPVVGARVLVPFSGQRLMGVVTRLHDDPSRRHRNQTHPAGPRRTAILPDELMRLAAWIAQYYVAPSAKSSAACLPLAAEVKRHFVYRIAEAGRKVLYQGAEKGSSRRSKLTPEDQNREYAVLNYLEDGAVRQSLRAPLRHPGQQALLDGMVKKKWLIREAIAEERDARRLERIAVLVPETRLPNSTPTRPASSPRSPPSAVA